jgi:GxxExxY protein
VDDQTYQLIGAALEVHIELGCGFLEPVYQEALELEVGDRGIPFCPQAAMPTVRKETETKNLRNLCNLRIFPNSLPSDSSALAS